MLQALMQKEMGSMRGLTMFISDIRNASNKETEQKRVEKELAHIRKQFSDKSIDGYNLKKYVWKLLYMYMLGYDIEIGHMEALKLITSPKFSEKNAGYIACAMLWNENSEFLKLLVQSVRKDLSPQDEINQSLALAFVGNIGGQEFADSLSLDVQKVVISPNSRTYVRKKAALCLLRLIRKSPDCLPMDDFPAKLLNLLEDPNYGIVLAIVTLLVGMASHSTAGLEETPAKAIYLLNKLVFAKDKKNSVYKYYLTLCPWLQVKLLKLLQYFPPPTDPNVLSRLHLVVNEILTKTVMTKNENKNNADHSIMFEGINTIIHYSQHNVRDLMPNAIQILGKFIGIKEPNYKYLGLETMTKLANVPGTLTHIRKQHDIILQSLQDGDISIRKRALDLLYVACDKGNAAEIVNALVAYLQTASLEIREELVLKIAILAEKFATDLRWYIDVVLQLISIAGDFVSDDVWYRTVQIITNNEELQEYAATKCFQLIQNPMVHENGVKVAAYVLGEFADQIRNPEINGSLIFSSLHSKFITASDPTKALLLSSYVKLCNNYPEVKKEVLHVFQQHKSYIDTEIQQRACEYSSLLSLKDKNDIMEKVFDVMPNFTERQSLLEKRLKKQKFTTDRDVWNEEDKKGDKKDKKEKKGNTDDGEEGDEDDDDDDDDEEEEEEDDDDDEDDDDENGTESKEGQVKKSSSPQKTMDLFGGFGSPTAPSANQNNNNHSSSSSSASSSPSPSTSASLFPPQDEKSLTSFYGKDSGVVYESPELQIGAKISMDNDQHHSIKCVFYYGNRTAFSLTHLTIAVGENDSYRLQVRPVEPIEIPPKKQINQFFLFHCFKPFKGPVGITLNFTYQHHAKSLFIALPIILSRCIVPTQIDPQGFVNAWQKYGNEVIGMRKLESPPTMALINEVITNSLHLFLISGVEKTSENVVAAGTFHTMTKGANGQNVTMPCLVRVETKPNIQLIRVTIHSGHQTVSDALMNAVTKAFGASEA